VAAELAERAALIALLAAASVLAHAESVVKCMDAAGKVTYSNIRCEDQGLRLVGAVNDRTSVMPGTRQDRSIPKGSGRQQEATQEASGDLRDNPVVKPAVPLIDRLLK